MASKMIIERAKAALLDTDDLVLVEDDEVEDEEYTAEVDEDESESEKCNDDDDVASKGSENGTDQKENDGEKVTAKKSDKDPRKSKKSSKGVGKKLKNLLSAAADPFGMRKTDWEIDFRLGMQASNQKDRAERGSDDKQRNPDNTDVSLSPDTKRLKILEKENRSLEKLANKYLDGCIRLRQKVAELSKVEEQLSTVQADKDAFKAELRQLQKLLEDAKLGADTQNTQHRNEVARLHSQLELAKESFEKMKSTNEEQLNEMGKLKQELEAISNQKNALAKQFENTETALRLEVKQLNVSLQTAEKEKSEQAERVLQLEGNVQKSEAEASVSNSKNVELQQKLRATECEKDRIHSLFEAMLQEANAKIAELKRAILVLETDASTTTTAQTQSGGSFSCPMCGAQFSSLANMQLHAEDCNV